MSKIHHQKKTLLNRYKHKGIIILVILFLITGLIILYSTFSDRFTGGAVFSGNRIDSQDNSIPFSAKVDLPELDFTAEEIDLEISLKDSKGEFFLSDLGFNNLKNAETVLKNYKGSIKIDESGALELEGYAYNILINDMDVNKKDRPVRISVKELHFDSLKISGLFQKSLSFISSGKINEGEFLEIKDEQARINIEPFEGELVLENNELSLSGITQSLLIKPD